MEGMAASDVTIVHRQWKNRKDSWKKENIGKFMKAGILIMDDIGGGKQRLDNYYAVSVDKLPVCQQADHVDNEQFFPRTSERR